jgi:ABC-type lipoprotein export system ATPase subunit
MTTVSWHLELIDIEKEFQSTESGAPLNVLSGINLALDQSESAAIIGPSGSGKTTLLNIIGALDQPARGKVLIGGDDISKMDRQELAGFRNRRIGFVFQLHHLLPQCTVLENVLLPTLANNDAELKAGAGERAQRLLKRVGLEHRVSHRPGQLSGGERQRVAVVRALINQPKLLLADEPTGALDRKSSETLTKLLLELNSEEKVTLIVVTHSMKLASEMNKVFELVDGKLQQASKEVSV